ncbi:hypothetical protein J6590_088740 [Homalodisca vitripennis]|nr:hypothetical protein J6590_088740 [Homalodisca vitripennis]
MGYFPRRLRSTKVIASLVGRSADFSSAKKCRLPELPCCGYYHCVDGLCTHPDYMSYVKFPVPIRNRTDDKLRRIFYW